MHWNYRLIQRKEYVEIVEMHYEDDASLTGYTDGLLTAQDKDDMMKTLALMLNDVKTKPIIQESELPKWESED